MERIGIVIALCFKLLCVENFMLQSNFPRDIVDSVAAQEDYEDIPDDKFENSYGVLGFKNQQPSQAYDKLQLNYNERINKHNKKPCLVVIVSNGQNPSMQSLLRKYRYDSNGELIPSSVKYYIKMHQDYESSSHLVPLAGKAFSPLGGFVRYYKEVPPVPTSL